MDIARACNIDGIENELLNIALDGHQSLRNRIDATNAIKSKGSSDTILKLKPLLLLPADQDPYDELKGLALIALWPKHISMKELFKNITPPKRESTYGMYQVFLSNLFKENLEQIPIKDLYIPLECAENQKSRHELPYVFRMLIEDILTFVWDNLEHEELIGPFTKALFSRLRKYDEITRRGEDSPYWDTLDYGLTKRKLVLNAILPLISNPEEEVIFLTAFGMPLFVNDDLPWLVEKIRSEKSEIYCKSLAEIIRSAYNVENTEHLAILYSACEENIFLADSFEWLFNPIGLDSPEGKRLKDMYISKRERQKKTLLEPPVEDRIAMCLDDFESGDLDAWWKLNQQLTLDYNSTYYGDDLNSDITSLPGWKISDSRTRSRILAAAKIYLLNQDPKNETWLGTNIFYRPAIAGYRALVLLQILDTDFIQTLDQSVWEKWASTIIAFPIQRYNEEVDLHSTLIQLAYEYAPSEIIESIFEIIKKEVSENKIIFILRECSDIWDDRLAESLLRKSKEYESTPEAHEIFLEHLLKNDSKGAKEYALAMIPEQIPSRGRTRENAINAAIQLFLRTNDAGWGKVWPAIKRYPNFGRMVVERVAAISDLERINVWTNLSENNLADLFIWLEQKFPRSEDPDTDGDGLYDELIIEVEVDIKDNGSYVVDGGLHTEFSYIDFNTNY
ncbi:MAG: hypothetical protein IH948_10435, partial [Bacteroidetes bacterium]|nr:hypothetical protein [Bacteroidota bacterium]